MRTLKMTACGIIVLLSQASLAQDSGVGSVLERYGGLDIARDGPTIDAQLGQKMLRRGNTYNNLQRYELAIEEYRKAISADPGLVEAYRNLANVYYYLERYDEAKPVLARFIALQNEQPGAPLLAAVKTLGELERRDGNFDTAIALDLRAIELEPENDSQVHIMANTYHNAGATDLAIRVYQAAIRANPGNAFFDRSLGRMLEQEGRLEEALAAYESAAAKDPESDFYADLVAGLQRRLQR